MKINGKVIEKQGVEVIVFPRKDGDIIFKAKPVTEFSDFIKLCPIPVASKQMKPGGVIVEDVEHPDYKKAIAKWSEKKAYWMMIQSLNATENLTWDLVNLSDSDTWDKFDEELSQSGLSPIETVKLMDIIAVACGLTQQKIEEATKRFLAGQAAQQKGQ